MVLCNQDRGNGKKRVRQINNTRDILLGERKQGVGKAVGYDNARSANLRPCGIGGRYDSR